MPPCPTTAATTLASAWVAPRQPATRRLAAVPQARAAARSCVSCGSAAPPPLRCPRPLRTQHRRGEAVCAGSLLSSDTWALWAVLLTASACGLASERTKVGKLLSAPIVTTLLGLALSNVGAIPASAPVYGAVTSFLLPLSVPLLLFGADMRRVVRDTGRLLLAFLIGAAGVVAGSVVALALAPMAHLAEDAWKITAALCARHIGGAVNYVATCEALQVAPSLVAAGLAADNLCCAAYFAVLFSLAPSSGAITSESSPAESSGGDAVEVNLLCAALAVSACICASSVGGARALGIAGFDIPLITALSVALATLFPRRLEALVPAGEAAAKVLLHLFFFVVGACGSLRAVLTTAPALFLVSALQMAVHLVTLLPLGSKLGFTRPELLIASNANVGGPTTAAGMAATLNWRTLLVPGILLGVFGYAIATFLSIGLGYAVFQPVWAAAVARTLH